MGHHGTKCEGEVRIQLANNDVPWRIPVNKTNVWVKGKAIPVTGHEGP
jgi:hypothetical protein